MRRMGKLLFSMQAFFYYCGVLACALLLLTFDACLICLWGGIDTYNIYKEKVEESFIAMDTLQGRKLTFT